MPVIYKAKQSFLANKEGKRLFHPVVNLTGNVSTTQLAKEIAAYSSLTPGDVKNTLDNLVVVVTQHLQSSESVTLDGLGTFRITLKSTGNGVETREEVSSTQAVPKVRFKPICSRQSDGSTTRSLLDGIKFVNFEKKDKKTNDSENDGDDGDDKGGDIGMG
jgi:predicted histone-like DNA-binding protein